MPKKILLAWPQFYVEEGENNEWVDFEEIFLSAEKLDKQNSRGFSNDEETLFEGVEHSLVDFLGKSKNACKGCYSSSFDLTPHISSNEGFFDTRDELFLKFGSLHKTFTGRMFEVWF